MEDALGIPDPQWEYALLIRAELERYGRYVCEVDTRDAQARVDIQWAARQAGRLLGVEVRIELSAPFGHAESTVTATVRCVDADDARRRRAEDGLVRLLRSVQEVRDSAGTTAAVAVPMPRGME
jgi:hypothetical protein